MKKPHRGHCDCGRRATVRHDGDWICTRCRDASRWWSDYQMSEASVRGCEKAPKFRMVGAAAKLIEEK